MRRLLLATALLAGCATTQTLTPAAQARFDRCESAMRAVCHDHAHGDAVAESACMRDARAEYARLAGDEAQRQFVVSHGCTAAAAQ